MKKFFLVFLLVFALFLGACGDSQADYAELFDATIVDMSNAGAMSADIESSMLVNMEIPGESDYGMSTDIVAYGDMQFIMEDSGDMLFAMYLESSFSGISYSANTYYLDGYYYQNIEGEKTKFAFPVEDMVDWLAYNDLALTSDDVLTFNMVESGGFKTLTATLDEEAFAELSAETFATLDSILVYDYPIEVEYGEMVYTFVFDSDDNLVSYEFVADIIESITMYDQEVGEDTELILTAQSIMVISNIEFDDVEVNYPEDLADYYEVSY